MTLTATTRPRRLPGAALPLPAVLAAAVVAAPLAAQIGYPNAPTSPAMPQGGMQNPQNPQTPQNPLYPQYPQLPPSGFPLQGQPQPFPGLGQDPYRTDRPWLRPPLDGQRGFPLFPDDLGGYGLYPMQVGALAPLRVGALPPPAYVPGAPDWPSWVKTDGRELRYEPTVALLIRQSDRVWVRPPEEQAAVPLYFHDATRELVAGSDVEVRQTGEFLLLFHDGARLASTGMASVHVVQLDDQEVQLDVRAFSTMHLSVRDRTFAMRLPDGSTVQVDGVVPADPEDVVPPARLVLDRLFEPEAANGRAQIGNVGERPVRWLTPFGEVELAPGQRATFFLVPPRTPLPPRLVSEGTSVEDRGAARRFLTRTGDGAVTFSGARFELPAGSVLELDPLLGTPFETRGTAQ